MSETELKKFEERAGKHITSFLQKQKMATVADIVKKFPHYQRVVVDVLDDLKEAGKVYWEEWKPLPTMIHAGGQTNNKRSYDWLTRQSVTV